MTLRIQDGDLLIDSGILANSADCCCDEPDCTGKCTIDRVLASCADTSCHCIESDYGTQNCQGGVKVTISATLNSLVYNGVTGGSCTPSCPSIDGTYQTADCNSDLTADFCGSECSFTNGLGQTQYAQSSMHVDVGFAPLVSGWQCVVTIYSGGLTRGAADPTYTTTECGAAATGLFGTMIRQLIFTYPRNEFDDWQYEPGVNCPDECNTVVQRAACVSTGTALTLDSTVSNTRAGGAGGCNIATLTVTAEFL